MKDTFDQYKWFKNQYLNENENVGKYEAIEKSLAILKSVGYTIDDKIYKALIAERARLEK
jgi:hypothetical protein